MNKLPQLPFRLTADIVCEAKLDQTDVGLWCLLVDGCYHLFNTEQQALSAYEKLLSGVLVR